MKKNIKRAAAVILAAIGLISLAGAHDDQLVEGMLVPFCVGACCLYASDRLLKNDSLEDYE